MRVDRRYQVGVLAALMNRERKFICFVTVDNLSAGGARLATPNPQDVPDHFLMRLTKSGPYRDCSVVWRENDAVGVRIAGFATVPTKMRK